MFTAEIKMNGSMIYHIYGHNEGLVDDGQTLYTYDMYDVERHKLKKGTVEHWRDDGIKPLLIKILKEK